MRPNAHDVPAAAVTGPAHLPSKLLLGIRLSWLHFAGFPFSTAAALGPRALLAFGCSGGAIFAGSAPVFLTLLGAVKR